MRTYPRNDYRWRNLHTALVCFALLASALLLRLFETDSSHWFFLPLLSFWILLIVFGPRAYCLPACLALPGTIANALVIFANGGKMPVVTLSKVKGYHIPMTDQTQLPWLADWIFGSISPGDLLLYAAICIFAWRLGTAIGDLIRAVRADQSPSPQS